MKNIILYMLLIACISVSCSRPSCVIKGDLSLPELEGKQIYLQVINNEIMQPEIIDSALIQRGKFRFERQNVNPETALLIVFEKGKGIWTTQFILENGCIEIKTDEQKNAQLSGTPNNELLQEHLKNWYVPLEKMRRISDETSRLEATGRLTGQVFDSLDQISRGHLREMRLLTLAFVKENINNPAGKSQLMEIMGLPHHLLVEVVEKADSASLQSPLLKKIAEKVNIFKAVAIGKPFQDVTTVDLNNQRVNLSDYAGKGKYVLIDFWASWCKPCCTEMPEIKQLYKKYSKKGLEIVGISSDQDENSWKKKVVELQMNWPQMRDVTGEASQKYIVNAIPHTILLDPSGIIIARNLRGKELEEKIVEYLKQ